VKVANRQERHARGRVTARVRACDTDTVRRGLTVWVSSTSVQNGRELIEVAPFTIRVVDHAYGRDDRPDDGASASVAAKLEAQLAAKREERAA
jgi:hypothetical protein